MINEMVCPWWLAYTFDHPLRKLVHRPEKLYGPHLQKGDTAYDLGCGMGFNALGIAELVGPKGRVIAVDIQEKMFEVLKKRAQKAGLDQRITCLLATGDRLGLPVEADFAVAFWMIHELPDPLGFMVEVAGNLRKGGRFMIAEPKVHVSSRAFDETSGLCESSGFRFLETPEVTFSRAAVFEKE